MSKKTIILGANTKPEKYAYKAANMLVEHGHEIVPVGVRSGEVAGYSIHTDKQIHSNVDTITLYINPLVQEEWKEYIFNTHPKRVIFNPGTENPQFEAELSSKGVVTEEACTLVLLSTNQY